MRDARVVVIAATNKPNDLDEALRRPGRIDREVAVGIPNEEARFEILTKMLSAMPHRLSEKEIRRCCSISHGYVGADLRSLCQEAAFATLNRLRERRKRLKKKKASTDSPLELGGGLSQTGRSASDATLSSMLQGGQKSTSEGA
eukprot:CAMPEP_0185269726 /NCGR_PEP_ID=MMETSP1359-20130426/40660_1 /TAXON_ID=552665 /ORGANISM="Bigelowiella longifila, Strain CCMP242" /LENGTH=143 /DNA_ID=CAMNT_0027861035 /DNA_START=9 /DNA_END=436 /DNA_ORIENTATION=-